jgi:hypothetical protein
VIPAGTAPFPRPMGGRGSPLSRGHTPWFTWAMDTNWTYAEATTYHAARAEGQTHEQALDTLNQAREFWAAEGI